MPLGHRRRANAAERRRLRLYRALGIAGAAVVSALVLAVLVGNTDRTVTRNKRTAARPAAGQAARTRPAVSHSETTSTAPAAPAGPASPRPRPKRPAIPAYRVGVETVRMVDPSRTVSTATGAVHRSFETIVRYPILSGGGQPGGPFPLIVFGHGFAVDPGPYALLLDAWTRAGFVVAAPVFPLENANAPGGPDEKDLPNQPGDMSLVITWLITAAQQSAGPLAGTVNPRQIAVTGQSDGGDTALATAYDPAVRDQRVGAAMILSGAEDPFAASFTMAQNGPPLLAVQGTADTINPPDSTYSFYRQAAAPKFLLQLLGAGHQPPYTQPGPELDAVKRTTIAFLDDVFKRRSGPLRALLAAGNAGPGTALTGGAG
jgi:fermentation-respiration switch protein FrsA (DUF1100 family)